LINRTAVFALCVTVALGAAAVPCAAAEAPATKAKGKLTQLSAASKQVLAKPAVVRNSDAGQQQPPAGAPSSPGSFFKSTRGKVTLVLMAAGAGFTFWSINHDRKPVKSPIR
jgi:hypothetical protein